ncbi:MAG TPA: DEAD/DEAH box helicase [Candidatus Limnocylindrales bacterium]|nr:DEAD/DEAH box helicase [Candidatus Limnocylindrales bacterium]
MPLTTEMPRGEVETSFDLNKLKNNLSYVEETSPHPVAKNRDKLKEALRKSDNLILEADPGSGKSTVAPISFLNELLQDNPDARIAVTQPRRLATSSVAEFVGKEVGEEFVDHRIEGHGFTKQGTSRIEFSVVESLLNELVNDEMLTKYDAVMVDEVHERSISIDILLPLLKRAQEKRAKDGKKPLKIVLASATLDAKVLTDYFPDAERLHVEGVPFDVEEKFSDKPIKPEDRMEAAAEKAAEFYTDTSKKGHALIFMPGGAEIRATEDAIRSKISDPNLKIITLMGGDQGQDPYKLINDIPENEKVLILATDVAETSLTIKGVKMVIDSGLMKRPNYDPNTRLTTLETREHTKGNWTQRKRRAGRIEDGEAYALFTKAELDKRDDHQVAEFLRTDLTPLILKMKSAGINDVINFPYIEHPGNEVINQGIDSLQRLGALDSEGAMTAIGREMARLNQEPNIARMLVEAKKRDCVDAVALIASAMQSKDSIFSFDRKSEKFSEKFKEYIDPNSDFITLLNVWNDYIKDPKNDKKWQEKGFNPKALLRIGNEAKTLKKDMGNSTNSKNGEAIDVVNNREAIDMSIASGLMPSLMVGARGSFRLETGSVSGIKIDKSSVFSSLDSGWILSGKIRSLKNERTRSTSQMNMNFDKEKMLMEYWYLRKIFNSEKSQSEETKKEAVTEELKGQEVIVPNEDDLKSEMEKIQQEAIVGPTEKVKAEAGTFLDKVKTNWSNLTDKVKEMFIKFKNSVKNILRI